jgi:hypothetical protein
MAVTKIWNIRGWVGRAVQYIENPEKTQSPLNATEHQSMEDVMLLAMQDERAAEFGHVLDYATDDRKTEMRQYVSALNCQIATARDEMMLTKRRFNKEGGNTAYHAYQAFKPREVTPEIAHEIGVKLAQELWGKRFEVVVATHLDRGHLHNHFVLNSVSFVDGKKFYDSKRFYRLLRRTSDRLCKEYALSVIEHPQSGKTQSHGERRAEREDRPTWRSLIKTEVDEIIRQSATEIEFFRTLKTRGYAVKVGQDISLCPLGKERFFRLARNFGEDYTLNAINRRIRQQAEPMRSTPAQQQNPVLPEFRRVQFRGNLQTVRRYKTRIPVRGFRALYVRYLYLLGKLPRGRPPKSPNKIPFLYREDLRKLDKYAQEIKLLARHQIDTGEQLFSYKERLTAQMTPLKQERTRLYNKLRRCKDEPQRAVLKGEIKLLSTRIGELRKEVVLCDDIAAHTAEMQEKMQKEQQMKTQDKKRDGKEQTKDELIR